MSVPAKTASLVMSEMMLLLCRHMSSATQQEVNDPDNDYETILVYDPPHEDFWPAWSSLVDDAKALGLEVQIPQQLLEAGLGQVYRRNMAACIDPEYLSSYC